MLPMPIVCIPLSPSSIQSGMAKDLAGYGFWCSDHHLLKVIAIAFHQSQTSEATYFSWQCQLMMRHMWAPNRAGSLQTRAARS
jgi:hypothetical protein